MIKSLKAFVSNESDATAIEYALIASLIAVALVTILTNLGTKLSSEFSRNQRRAQIKPGQRKYISAGAAWAAPALFRSSQMLVHPGRLST